MTEEGYAAFLIGDNNRDGLVEPHRLIFNSSANEERSSMIFFQGRSVTFL